MKKGFTLVEIMVCIILLSIILGVVTPNVIRTMNEKKQKTFFTSAKSILRQIEYDELINEGETKKLSTLNINGLSNKAYDLENSYVKMVDGETYLYLKGIGKFENMHLCDFTSSEVTVKITSEECKVN